MSPTYRTARSRSAPINVAQSRETLPPRPQPTTPTTVPSTSGFSGGTPPSYKTPSPRYGTPPQNKARPPSPAGTLSRTTPQRRPTTGNPAPRTPLRSISPDGTEMLRRNVRPITQVQQEMQVWFPSVDCTCPPPVDGFQRFFFWGILHVGSPKAGGGFLQLCFPAGFRRGELGKHVLVFSDLRQDPQKSNGTLGGSRVCHMDAGSLCHEQMHRLVSARGVPSWGLCSWAQVLSQIPATHPRDKVSAFGWCRGGLGPLQAHLTAVGIVFSHKTG